jgi:hypothetical protein
MNTSTIGIDKLTLTTPDFHIADPLNLNIASGVKLAGETDIKNTYLFTDSKGNEIKGSKAYLNSPEYNFTVQWYGNKPQAILQINPSKFIERLTLCTDTIDNIVHTIANSLQRSKIHIDLNSAIVSRLDIAVDSILKHTYREYRGLVVGKTHRIKEKAKNYTDSLTFGIGKGTSQFTTYDKGKEIEASKHGKPISISTPHTRFEARIFRNKGVQSKISEATTYNGFLNTPDSAFHKAYLNVVNTHVQIAQTQVQLPDITSTAEIMGVLRKQHPQTWLMNTLCVVMGAHSEKDISDIMQILDCALEVVLRDADRKTLHRNRVKLLKLEMEAGFLRKRLNKESQDMKADKHRELFETFILPFQTAV